MIFLQHIDYINFTNRVVGDSGMRKGNEECTYIQTLHLVSQDQLVDDLACETNQLPRLGLNGRAGSDLEEVDNKPGCKCQVYWNVMCAMHWQTLQQGPAVNVPSAFPLNYLRSGRHNWIANLLHSSLSTVISVASETSSLLQTPNAPLATCFLDIWLQAFPQIMYLH